MVADSNLIDELGGPTKVARLLGYAEQGGVQRVQNWKTRGIPARVKLAHPDLFQLHSSPSLTAKASIDEISPPAPN